MKPMQLFHTCTRLWHQNFVTFRTCRQKWKLMMLLKQKRKRFVNEISEKWKWTILSSSDPANSRSRWKPLFDEHFSKPSAKFEFASPFSRTEIPCPSVTNRETPSSSRPRLHAGNSHPVCGRRPPTPIMEHNGIPVCRNGLVKMGHAAQRCG